MIKSLFLRHNEVDSNINLKDILLDIQTAQQQLLSLAQGIQITNREIGELVISTLPIINPNYLELNGALYTRTQYPKLYKHLVLIKVKHPECFCTQEEYDASMSAHHLCTKYVLDEENETIRLPRVSGLLEISGLTAHGFFDPNTITSETIPNLKGDFGSVTGANSTRLTYANTHTGVFSKTETRNTKYYMSRTSGDATDNSWGATFDASAYDPRYKDDAKLHPQTSVFRAYVVVGRDSAYPHVVYSWFGENSEVRVYSDGYCTQSGTIENSDLLEHQVTFNFPFASNVNVQLTPYHLGADSYDGNYLLTELANTSFTVKHPRNLGFKYLATGKVNLNIIPTEVDYSCQSTDILEMMEYTKAMKEKMQNTEIVLEMPEEPDPNKMYIVVSPDNIHVTQDVQVDNHYYGSRDTEEVKGILQATFEHSGDFELETNEEHEVFTVNVSAENPEQTFTFDEFDSLPTITELPENTYVKEITKTSVTIGYNGFTPEVHNDTENSEFNVQEIENGESVSGTLSSTLYHSGESHLNVENVEEQFKFVSPDEEFTLDFAHTFDTVPTIEADEDSEIQIISISTTKAVIKGQGSGTVRGTVSTRVFDTENKSKVVHCDITLSKEYIEPQLISDNSDVEITLDGHVVHVTGTLTADVEYPNGTDVHKEFSFEVIETHKEPEPEPETPEPSEPTEPSEPSLPEVQPEEPETVEDPTENVETPQPSKPENTENTENEYEIEEDVPHKEPIGDEPIEPDPNESTETTETVETEPTEQENNEE